MVKKGIKSFYVVIEWHIQLGCHDSLSVEKFSYLSMFAPFLLHQVQILNKTFRYIRLHLAKINLVNQ